MDPNKKNKSKKTEFESFIHKSSKWQELANFISRKNRDICILKDVKKDPNLKKIHEQRDKIHSKLFKKQK